jgi:prevent-host-death family protein
MEANIHDAKTHLSRLLSRVAQGEEVTIAKAGRPVAKLVPIPPKTGRRIPGSARGRIVISAEFDEPLPKEVQESFE